MKKKAVPINTVLSTRDAIIKAARELFSRLDYLSVSMSQIAGKLPITKTALYYHFQNKQDLYLEVLRSTFSNLNELLNQAIDRETLPVNKIHSFLETYIKFAREQTGIVLLTVQKMSKLDKKIVRQIMEWRRDIGLSIVPAVKAFLKQKGQDKMTDPDLMVTLLLGMLGGLILDQFLSNKSLDARQISRQIIAIIS